MEEFIPCPLKDQETFQRVWQRVMAGRNDAQCPVEAAPSNLQGDLSCACLEALSHRQGEGLPEQCLRWEEAQPTLEPPAPDGEPAPPSDESPAPEPPQTPAEPELPPANCPCRDCDLPLPWEGCGCAPDRNACLRRQVMEALEGWQFYRYLARRVRGNDARVLNSMAGELHRCARKLSAAYFLITGLRYWPSELLSAPVIPSYWGALRTRHQAEQRQESAYRMAADDWDDPDMLELYTELTDGCQRRCHQLRALLEQGG